MDLNTTSKTSGSTALRPVTKGSAGRIGRPTQQRRHHTTIGVNGNNHRAYGGEFALDAPSTKRCTFYEGFLTIAEWPSPRNGVAAHASPVRAGTLQLTGS